MVIVTDSTLQLGFERCRELGLHTVEYPLYLNDEPYPHSMDMSKEEKEKLRNHLLDKNNKIITSGLTEKDLKEMYNRFPDDKIISMHQSLNSSKATGEVLRSVSEEMSETRDITVFDSYNIGGAYTVQVLEAAKAVKGGIEYGDLMNLLERNRNNTGHFGILYDLFFLNRTGRIGFIKAFMGSAMKIIPLLSKTEDSGGLKSFAKVKNYIQANQRFIKEIEEDLQNKNSNKLSVVIAYCGDHKKECEHFRGLMLEKGWDAEIEISYTNHSCMPHEGPDFYDIGYVVL